MVEVTIYSSIKMISEALNLAHALKENGIRALVFEINPLYTRIDFKTLPFVVIEKDQKIIKSFEGYFPQAEEILEIIRENDR